MMIAVSCKIVRVGSYVDTFTVSAYRLHVKKDGTPIWRFHCKLTSPVGFHYPHVEDWAISYAESNGYKYSPELRHNMPAEITPTELLALAGEGK